MHQNPFAARSKLKPPKREKPDSFLQNAQEAAKTCESKGTRRVFLREFNRRSLHLSS